MSTPKPRLIADHITETTPPRRSDEESSHRGFWIAIVWLAVVAGAGFLAARGCG